MASTAAVMDHLSLEVTPQATQVSQVMAAVADTGAQVCDTGTGHLPTLGLKPAMLHRRAGIQDLSHIHLRCAGAAMCRIRLPDRDTVQEVYFIEAMDCLYVSQAACTELKLILEGFPSPMPLATALSKEVDDTPRPWFTTVPHKLLEENVPCLEQWLLQQFSSTTFNTERRPLRMMTGAPHHIHLKDGANPSTCHTPTSIPKHWEAEVKTQLDEDVMAGILRPVPAGEATEWCARRWWCPRSQGNHAGS